MESITAHQRIDIIEARMGWPSTGIDKYQYLLEQAIAEEMRRLPIGPAVADGHIYSSLIDLKQAIESAMRRVAIKAALK